MILGIDPGPFSSAYALVRPDYAVVMAAKVTNSELRGMLGATSMINRAVIEGIGCYGAPVGRETFETCYQIGRLQEICDRRGIPVTMYARQEYANAICGGKSNDTMLRQALLLRFGGDKKGEPLHALKGTSDLRSAYAVAVYYLDTLKYAAK